MPTGFFSPQSEPGAKLPRARKRRSSMAKKATGVARVSYVAKAKLLNQMTKSITTGNHEMFKRDLESAMTIFSREARISDAQLMSLRHALSSIEFDYDKEATKMLSTGDVAKKLGVSNQAVINWIENGKMKAYRSPGGHYRIPADQFRTTEEQDSMTEAIFERLWAKRQGMPPITQDDFGDL